MSNLVLYNYSKQKKRNGQQNHVADFRKPLNRLMDDTAAYV